MVLDFQFIIPHDSGELLNSHGNNYFVKQVHNARDLGELLRAAKNAFTADGANIFYIFDHFDTFFSLIENANQPLMQSLTRATDLLFLTIDKLGQSLAIHLAEKPAAPDAAAPAADASGEPFDREAHLNLTKMLLYLSTGFVRAIDRVVAAVQAGGAAAAGQSGKAGGKRGATGGGGGGLELEVYQWDDKRYKLMVQLFNVFQLRLEKLWSLCIAEESFVNMICDLAYRTLELPVVREKRVGDMCFQLLGTAIKRYNHALTFPVRLQQILRTSEIAVIPAARGLHILHSEFGITSIYSVVLKDLVDALAVDAADNQTTKHFCQFLGELGATQTKVLMPHLSHLGEELLNCDSYVLRNTVLQIMGDTVCGELSSEDLADDLKEIREEFLEDMFNHILDVSAHVRSKSLQIWSHMRAENSVPLTWQHRVLKAAAERLHDKGTLVRKNAVLLIKAFLETNPFAAKLSLQELLDKNEVEVAKLQEIRDRMLAIERLETERQALWEAMANEAMRVIDAELTERPLATAAAVPTPTAEVAAKASAEILQLLLDNEPEKAIQVLRRVDSCNHDELVAMAVEEQVQYYAVLLRSYMFMNPDHSEEFTTQGQTVKFLDDSIQFATVMAQAVPVIENMMLSKINSDVFEAIDFFTTAHLFGIKGTEAGMRKMLCLVWSGDKEKREAVSRAYTRVLFGTDQEGRAHTIKVVSNLCAFFADLTQGQFSAMEMLMREWIDNDNIDTHIIQVLFERLTLKLPDTSENTARLSLQLLCTAAEIRPSIATANFELIQTIAYGERGQRDPRLFALCLHMLRLSGGGDQELGGDLHRRYDGDSQQIATAVQIYERLFFHPAVRDFDGVTISTLDLVYNLCSTPDLTCQQLVKGLCDRLASAAADAQTGGELVDMLTTTTTATQATQSTQDDAEGASDVANALLVPKFVAARLLHLIGYLALKELVYLDIDVYSNMKYRQELADTLKREKKKHRNSKNSSQLLNASVVSVADGNSSRRSAVNPTSMSASKALKRLSETGAEPQQDPDEMLDGATAEDSNAELILHICETQLYDPAGLCARFVPVIMDVLRNPGRYRDEPLQQAACLCLIRFMTVSARFCEENMPFLMNVLQLTSNVRIKCNIMVGLSDITFRFPNVVQSWTSHIYATLHESNDEIRLTSVKMLSHLIQHEMIRVKGQISDLAMCIVDNNAEIRHITLEFFKVIAQKSNILYNVLPDIISRLSGAQASLAEEQYHVIMRYVMGLIQKDRQVESLVEKLCLRFRVTQEKRQWRDIAFCLSLLTYTEKTIRKLIEHIPNFKDKVQEDEVYDSFKQIIAAAGRTAKPEFKTIIGEFETKLENCLRVRDGGEAGVEGGGGGGGGKAEGGDSSVAGDGADSDGGRRSDQEMPPPQRIPRGRGRQARGGRGAGGRGGRGAGAGRSATGRARGGRQTRDDSDSDSDGGADGGRGGGDDAVVPSASASRRTARKPVPAKKPSKVIDTDSSESSSSEEEVDKRRRKHR